MTDRRQEFNGMAAAYSNARPGYPEKLWGRSVRCAR